MTRISTTLGLAGILTLASVQALAQPAGTALVVPVEAGELRLRGIFFETATGRTPVPLMSGSAGTASAGGRQVDVGVTVDGTRTRVSLRARPSDGIVKWGFLLDAADDEHFTGLMERVVDGPQQASWEPGLGAALDLRGQIVEMIVKPTTSIYAPFFVSSRGYGLSVQGDWPGFFDFCRKDPQRVRIEFEGEHLDLTVYRGDPAAVVRAHALDAGPPWLPPRWVFTPWRWRDEHTQRSAYYDGTPVTGPFNADLMEDVLMMEAYGIPNGVYWIDRPWGTGAQGYDDFEIDGRRLPYFEETITWLGERGTRLLLWIAAFFQGRMEQEGLDKGFTLPGQPPLPQNYPMVDFTNPDARAYWQQGVAKLLTLGVAGFKLDRGEEQMPETGPYRAHDGRNVRLVRNAYPALFADAAFEVTRAHRGDDFVLISRGAYTGSAPRSAFWGGDVTGTAEGLRASIVAVQRAAVMGYPVWGSDTCGYGLSPMDQDVCARWLAFSAFTPIMEVGPTRNVGFWNLPREPSYDPTLIAVWRLYARLHDRLADYSLRQAELAHRTGQPIVRPLMLSEPGAPAAWTHWQTYLYGPDLLVTPVWETGRRQQQVYLPAGSRWRNAWKPGEILEGGRVITVAAELHQIPLFVRVGADLDLGDLEREWAESRAAADRRPDLARLDAAVRRWFDTHKAAPRR